MACQGCGNSARPRAGKNRNLDRDTRATWFAARQAAGRELPAPQTPGGHRDLDRDTRATWFAARRAAGREQLAPQTPGGHRDKAWGGALRRMTVGGIGPSREDEHRYVTVPGRYVPVGFARYVSPLVDPYNYEYYRISGWQVAVPRTISGIRVNDLLHRIYWYGPQSAGYVRLGGTMVPAILDTGDRMTLAQTGADYEPYSLSP